MGDIVVGPWKPTEQLDHLGQLYITVAQLANYVQALEHRIRDLEAKAHND